MPDTNQENQSQHNSGEGNLPDKVKALLAEVEAVSAMLREIAEYLPPSYPSESLLHLSRSFENINQQFASFAGVKGHRFYEIIHRSGSRLSAVKGITKAARNLALLFEKYAKFPNHYSAVHSRLQIHRLQIALENLKSDLV
jgi:hypothetical protein